MLKCDEHIDEPITQSHERDFGDRLVFCFGFELSIALILCWPKTLDLLL